MDWRLGHPRDRRDPVEVEARSERDSAGSAIVLYLCWRGSPKEKSLKMAAFLRPQAFEAVDKTTFDNIFDDGLRLGQA